jgi:AraC-like DNA-binding protein
MKNNDPGSIIPAIDQLLSGPLKDPEALHVAEPAMTAGEMPYGFHCHDAWELFCPMRASLQFVVSGRPPITIPNRALLMVPPGCLHISVDRLPQSKTLKLLVMNLPGSETPYGGLSIGDTKRRSGSALSPAELAAWTDCAGVAPGILIEQAALAATAGTWGRQRALGLLRILVAGYAEVLGNPKRDRLSLDARRVAEVQIFLHSHYYEPELSVTTVAAAVGLSASHLGFLFRKTTGLTLHQALIDLRLRRASDLLTRTPLSIKEIAAMTGWSNQLYFSAAYRRRHGRPPSAGRSVGQGRPAVANRVATGSAEAAARMDRR